MSHAVQPIEAEEAANLPASHNEHEGELGDAEYFPAMQSRQLKVDASVYFPDAHSPQDDEPAGE